MLKQRMILLLVLGILHPKSQTLTLPHQTLTLPQQSDERLSSVLFFTGKYCRTSSKGIHPLFLDLCNKCKHMTVYVFPLPAKCLGGPAQTASRILCCNIKNPR
nr:uncharacterized protein LOC103434498 [Malus domestica]